MRTTLRLLGFLRPFMGEVLLSVALGAATVASGIGLLGASAFLIAKAALHPSIAVLEVAIVGVRFFGISRGVLRYLERLVSHSSNFRLLAELRVWFYQAVEPLAPARLSDLHGGDLLNRAIADIEVLEDFYVRIVAPPFVAMIITIGTGWFIGHQGQTLGWLVAVGMAVGGLLIPALIYVAARPSGEKISRARSALNVVLVDGIQGMTEWVAFGEAPRRLASIQSSSRDYENLQAQVSLVGAAGAAFGQLNHHLWVWLVVLAGVPMVRSGQLDGVSLAVIVLVTGAAFEAVLPLSQSALLLESALQSARRLFAIAAMQPAVREPENASPAPGDFHISINYLSFRYPEEPRNVLEDFNLDLPAGKRIALVGPSGAGKTTIINILLRFWDPPEGTIRIGGQDILNTQVESMRRRMAVIPQSVYLFSGTLADNIHLAVPDAPPEKVDLSIHQAGLDRLVSRLPKGKNSWIGAQGSQLSGGERQRIAAARAFLKNADILILDEPVANLDAISAREILNQLEGRVGHRSLIWITHDMNGLEAMDEILVLREGRVIERGTHAELLLLGGWYAQALTLQQRVLL